MKLKFDCWGSGFDELNRLHCNLRGQEPPGKNLNQFNVLAAENLDNGDFAWISAIIQIGVCIFLQFNCFTSNQVYKFSIWI